MSPEPRSVSLAWRTSSGAQDVLAEVGLLGHDDPQLFNRHAQHTAGGPHHGRQVHPLTGQQALLPEELPLAVGDDHFLFRFSELLDNLDGALEDDDEVIARIAVGEEHVTGADLHLVAVETEGGQLRITEQGTKFGAPRWRCVVPPGVLDRFPCLSGRHLVVCHAYSQSIRAGVF